MLRDARPAWERLARRDEGSTSTRSLGWTRARPALPPTSHWYVAAHASRYGHTDLLGAVPQSPLARGPPRQQVVTTAPLYVSFV